MVYHSIPDLTNQEKLIAVVCNDCRRVQVYRGCYCGDRFGCRSCKKKRAKRLQAIYLRPLQKFRWPAMITFTLIREGDPAYDVKRIQKKFRKLKQRKVWKHKVKAYFGGYEVKENQVHLHIIADCVWWDQKEISRIWGEITGSSYIVDIRRVHNKRKALKEVFKYITKDTDFDKDDLKSMKEELRGVRLVVASRGLSSLDTEEIFDDLELNKALASGGKITKIKCDACGYYMTFGGAFSNILDLARHYHAYKLYTNGKEVKRVWNIQGFG